MNRETLRDQLGLEPTATDPEILAAAKAAKARSKRLAESAPNPEAAKVHRDGIAELDAMLAACGLSTDPPKEPAASPLSASMLRDLGAASPIPSMGGTGAEALGSRMVLEPGRVLANRYEIQKRLGAGGMGAVFAAFDRSKQETIAIKVILPELVAKKEARERFLQEAKVATSLGHPGIVKVFDVQSDGELMFLTMELLEGQTLRQQMEERRRSGKVYSVAEVQRIVRTLAETLGYAHGKTVHRDVKPENVFVCADGRLVLMDFGLAKLLSASALSRSGTAMGTAYYMAPEQLRGASKVDHRADQFAVGVMAYELLTGKLPTGMAQPLRKVRKEVPAGFAAAVEKAMAQEPKDRHADMAALVAAMGKSVALPKVSGPVLLAAVGGLLLLVLGVVFGGDIAAEVKRWLRDPALIAAVAKQRQAVVAQHAELATLAATLGRPLGAPFIAAHEESLREADTATKAEDDSQAKRVLDEAAARCERQKTELLAAGTSDLAGKLAQLEQRQKKLEDRGKEIESEPMRLKQEADRQQSLLDGGHLDPARVEEARGLKARAEVDQKVAQEVAQLWRQRADGLLAELAQAIGAAKPALGSGKGDVVSAAESLARGIGVAQRLDAIVQEVPPLMKQVDELQRLRNEARKVSLEAVPPAASAVDRWLAAARSALSGEDYKTTRQNLGDVVWLLDVRLQQDWAARRSETTSLLGRLEQLPKPKGATDGGPVAWLADKQSRVEAQVAAADRDADFAGWSKTLESGRSLATAIEARAVLETELQAEIRAASGKVPTGAWDSLQGDRAALLAALWQRDETVAGQKMQALRGTKANRDTWLNLATEVGAVRSAVEAVRKQGVAHAAEPELQALAARIASPETTQAQLREALAGAQDAAASAYVGWATSQPIGGDEAIGKQIEAMKVWALTPATKAAVDAEVASLRLRAQQRNSCADIVGKVQRLNGASFARDLKAFQAEVAKVGTLEQELAQPSCTRMRLGEIVGELSQLGAKAETAFVDGATELAHSRLPSQLSGAQEIVQWLAKDFGTNAKFKAVASAAAAAAAAAERERPWRELQQAGFREAFGSTKDPATGFPTRIEHVASGAVLALIPAGEFQMGSPSSEADRSGDEQQHRRVVRSAFYLGVTEVTQSQWEKVTGSNPSYFKGANLPVETVSWDDCQEYLKKAGGGLRLPSEAEWEYACRAGTTTPFSFGGTITTDQVNYNGNYPYGNGRNGQHRQRTVPAGSLPANPWGLHEMHGNVWEWCEDGYAAYPANGSEEAARAAGARVLRGGGWSSSGRSCRAALRVSGSAGNRNDHVGFRLARTLPR